MIKAVIIDDEPLLVQSIGNMLQKHCPQLELVGTASTALSGKSLIKKVKPDLVFLDIQMPFGNGFDLLNSFEHINFQIIIISAFDKYALKAFKFDVLDYLLKPIDLVELKSAVSKATERIKALTLLQEANSKTQEDNAVSIVDQKLKLQLGKEVTFVDFDQVLYLASNGNYTFIYLLNNEQYLVTKQLGEFEKQLPSSIFYRVHNEYIINTKQVNKYIKGRGGYAELVNGIKVKISNKRKNEFLKRYKI